MTPRHKQSRPSTDGLAIGICFFSAATVLKRRKPRSHLLKVAPVDSLYRMGVGERWELIDRHDGPVARQQFFS